MKLIRQCNSKILFQILKTLGIEKVKVKKKPNILFFSTGNEITDKSRISNWQVRNSNSHYVNSLSKSFLYNYKYGGILRDKDANLFSQKIKNQKIDNVIMEASSHGLIQNRLDGYKFNLGIFTNLSQDHLDYHKTFKDYLNSKLKLFRLLMKKNSTIIFDNDLPTSKILKQIG